MNDMKQQTKNPLPPDTKWRAELGREPEWLTKNKQNKNRQQKEKR